MNKCSKEKNAGVDKKSSKDKKSNLSALPGKRSTQNLESMDQNIENEKLVKSCSSGKITKKGSVDSVRNLKIPSDSVYNVNDMSSEDLHNSLQRINKNPAEPFKFLSHILDDVDSENSTSLGRTKPTDIDLQLASLVRRVEMNKSLLERTNLRVKDINFIVEKNKILASKELDYDKDSLLNIGDCLNNEADPNIEHPGIDALQRTMKDTLQMLESIKKLASGDSDEFSSENFHKMESGSITAKVKH